MSKKVLIITYYWPPSGGAGVQRWVKFAKYLPEYGWEPIILTVDPDYAAYPVTDDSLLSEISGSTQVYRTPARNFFSVYNKDKSKLPSAGFAINKDNSLKGKLMRFIRGNFFIPDPRRGWNRFAFEKASELILSYDIINVITTSPPHSTQLIGLKLKKRFPGINWIADLRDPWTDIYYYDQFYPTFISKWIDGRFEKNVLRNSDKIITVGDSLKELFESKIPDVAVKSGIISNGYDESDFSGEASEPHKFTITYAGTLSDIYPLEGFVKALKVLEEKEYLIRFVGSVSPDQKERITANIHSENIQFIPYTDHQNAVRYMRESSVLLLIIPDHVTRKIILTGKLFEYLASGRPIICLGPHDGDAAVIIAKTKAGKTFGYYDSDFLGNYIAELFSNPNFSRSVPVEYCRKELTKKLASLLK